MLTSDQILRAARAGLVSQITEIDRLMSGAAVMPADLFGQVADAGTAGFVKELVKEGKRRGRVGRPTKVNTTPDGSAGSKGMSAEGRAKIAAAQAKRWAAKRAAKRAGQTAGQIPVVPAPVTAAS